ncbi:hypothetical protein ACMA5I_05905 [Paracoccaceae bacterium GXU_MW_L88]
MAEAEWRLHIGAHKTATTHLQDTLAAMADALAAQGVAYLPRDAVRPILQKHLWRPNWRYQFGGAAFERGIAEDLAALSGLPVRIVSEENILGRCAQILDAQPYPRLEQRVPQIVRGMAEGAPVRLFLSIRCFAGLAPGAYAEGLHLRQCRPCYLTAFRERITEAPPRWTGIVDRLRAALPDTPITIWRQEDYGDHASHIIAALTGLPRAVFDDMPDLPPPQITQTPSAAAVVDMEGRYRRFQPKAAWRAETAAIVRAMPVSDRFPKFDPLLDAEKAALQAAYAEDWAALAQMDGVTRITV